MKFGHVQLQLSFCVKINRNQCDNENESVDMIIQELIEERVAVNEIEEWVRGGDLWKCLTQHRNQSDYTSFGKKKKLVSIWI